MSEEIDMRKLGAGTRLLLRGGEKATKVEGGTGSYIFPHLIAVDDLMTHQAVQHDGSWRDAYTHRYDVVEVLSSPNQELLDHIKYLVTELQEIADAKHADAGDDFRGWAQNKARAAVNRATQPSDQGKTWQS